MFCGAMPFWRKNGNDCGWPVRGKNNVGRGGFVEKWKKKFEMIMLIN